VARILLLSPYHGGSHRAFAEGLAAHSRHQIVTLSLPARFWKWRMRGAALLLAQRARRLPGPVDLVVGTDMMNLAEFRALSGLGERPHVLYLHENQLAYPLPENDRPDYHFGFINLASALAADGVVFNSRFHRDAFFAAAPNLLRAMPDAPVRRVLPGIRRKSRVLPVGCELTRLRDAATGAQTGSGPPLILWNHRWEFDKAPEVFFRVLARLDDAGLRFRLALAGDSTAQAEPKPFLEARQRYGARVVCFGWVPDRRDYAALLSQADILVSTAIQENFGIAVVEAVACGVWPLLPRRLSYPEIMPRAWHRSCLYADESDLESRLGKLLRGALPDGRGRAALAREMLRYDWSALIATYDDLFDGLLAVPGSETH
jgi:glycosyltransferase involved in cell wall biosynthesis